ncbi:hypothetical protein P3T39_007264 [Kitasatospora sp. GP82]|nr:hypothetical protein [Kitasatospora sp. GP82]
MSGQAEGLPAGGMIKGLSAVGEGPPLGAAPVSYRGHHYPREGIAHGVWLYYPDTPQHN